MAAISEIAASNHQTVGPRPARAAKRRSKRRPKSGPKGGQKWSNGGQKGGQNEPSGRGRAAAKMVESGQKWSKVVKSGQRAVSAPGGGPSGHRDGPKAAKRETAKGKWSKENGQKKMVKGKWSKTMAEKAGPTGGEGAQRTVDLTSWSN